MKLISISDFVFEQEKSLENLFNEKLPIIKITSSYDKIVEYAKFVKKTLKLEMFVPCDEFGNFFKKPDFNDYNEETNGYFNANLDYELAKEKVLFEGFNSTGRFKVSSGFEDFSFLKYNNGNTQVYVTDYTKEEPNESLCYTIEDLIKYNLTLTQNAIKNLQL